MDNEIIFLEVFIKKTALFVQEDAEEITKYKSDDQNFI
jgi:hypothetical protein